MSTARRLAMCPVPLPDEALMSWVDHVAVCFGVTRAEAARAVGLVRRDVDTPGMNVCVVALSDGMAGRVEARTGLSAARVRAMTLRRYLTGPWNNSAYDRRNWVLATRSNACPDCLRENGSRWLLAWRVALLPVCVRHRRYLVGRCTCGRVLHKVALGAGLTSLRCPSRTAPSTSDVVSCGRPLVDLEAPAVDDQVLLAAQARVLAAVRNRRGQDGVIRQVELMWATALVTAMGTPDLVQGADDAVIDAFARFCSDRDSGRVPVPGSSGPVPSSPKTLVTAARESCLTTAALVRVASRLVFADDLDVEADWFCEVTRPDWTSEAANHLGRFHFMPARRVIEPFVRRGFAGAP